MTPERYNDTKPTAAGRNTGKDNKMKHDLLMITLEAIKEIAECEKEGVKK